MTPAEKRAKEIIKKGRDLGYEGTIIKNGKLTEEFIDWVSVNIPQPDNDITKRILESKTDDEKLVYYNCQDCGHEFPVDQGSRRRFCDVCIGRRQREGWNKRKPKGKK